MKTTIRHRRIRPFNTRDTYPEQRLDNDLCQAVVAGNLVFLRGQVGQDLETGASVGVGDAAAQAERAMANVALLLGEAGAELADICKIVVYLVDPRYREPVYRVLGRWLKGVFPVSTGVVVTALARPEWLVEIDVTAVIGARGWGLGTRGAPSLPCGFRRRVDHPLPVPNPQPPAPTGVS